MRLLILAFLVGVLACSPTEERPADLLPREKFTAVLLEAELLEARVNHERTIDLRTGIPVTEYYAEMFKAQGVTEEAFKRTFSWYVDHPAELKDVYNDVLTGLQQRVEVADSTGTRH